MGIISCDSIQLEIKRRHKLLLADCHQQRDSGDFLVAVSWNNQRERTFRITPVDCNRENFWEWLDGKVNSLVEMAGD
jgi:hypothetical protein